MVVLGADVFILARSGLSADVNAFSPEHDTIRRVPIVDGAILYECPYTFTNWILVFKNALYVPSMTHHLIPPFLMREAGVRVNDVPKIHARDPTFDDHSLYFPQSTLRIPLSLWGVFSYFPCRKPTIQELENIDDDNIILATPDGPWNPHSDVYARNEENMLDWEGNIVAPRDRIRIVLDQLPDDHIMASSVQVSSVENSIIDRRFYTEPIPEDDNTTKPLADITNRTTQQHVSSHIDEVDAHLKGLCPTLVPEVFAAKLQRQREVGHFSSTIGSCNVHSNETLFPEVIDDLSGIEIGSLDFDDEFLASSAFARGATGVSPEHLSKVWRLDFDTAKRTIQETTQLRKQAPLDSLSRNYPTNDRMLRYKRIRTYFYMDTFFATSKAQKSSRGHTCMQLFVSDMGFIFLVPMRSKSQVPAAIKLFAKHIGAPDAIISDPSGEQTLQEVKSFLQKIGTSLSLLEEGTQASNRAELYIGLIKESI